MYTNTKTSWSGGFLVGSSKVEHDPSFHSTVSVYVIYIQYMLLAVISGCIGHYSAAGARQPL